MGKLSDALLPSLRTHFYLRNLREPDEGPFAVIPAVHPDVGDLELYDEGDEITLVVGNFTHCHFAWYQQGADHSEKRVVADVLTFFDKIFAEEIEFWGSHGGGGGTRPRGGEGFTHLSDGSKVYVWSGPVSAHGV